MRDDEKKTLAGSLEMAVTETICDLGLLVSLYTAHIIVWLTLRRRGRGQAEGRVARDVSASAGGRSPRHRIR
jgi:hypothetical protein